MLRLLVGRFKNIDSSLTSSKLYNEQTFYRAFVRDIASCKKEVIIESPFITTQRINMLLPYFNKELHRSVRIIINTLHPQEHDEYMQNEAEKGTSILQDIGVEILFNGRHHRKLAIFD